MIISSLLRSENALLQSNLEQIQSQYDYSIDLLIKDNAHEKLTNPLTLKLK